MNHISIIRIVIISTHPIQYNAPLFEFLADSNDFTLKVFYTWGENSIQVYDPGFGKQRAWDIDLLSGYESQFVENKSADPGSHHYKGIINPHLIEEVSFFNPDAILVYGWKFHTHLKLMRHFKGKVPILFRGDSTLLDEPIGFIIKKLLRKQFLKWVYSHVDIALSPGSASDKYFEYVGLKANQIVRAPHAVDNERFARNGEWRMVNGETEKQGNGETGNRRKELGIPSEAITFLFAGKFEPKKNPLLLIRAFKKLYETHKNIHLIMVGDGILKTEIERELEDLNSLGYTSTLHSPPSTILPFQNQSQMPATYRLGDIFVLPSQGPGETWGLAINEAMACGRAVVASDKCGGAKDLIVEGKNGYVFTSGDADDLAGKMKLCLDNNCYIQMGEYAKEKIKDFSYESFLFALNKILV